MKSQAFASHFLSWLQEEIDAQRKLASLLQRQLDAVKRSSTADVQSTVAEIEEELRGGMRRELKRKTLTAAFSKEEGIRPSELTLGRVSGVLGDKGIDVRELVRRRAELRDTVAGVLKLNRRIATLARYHQGLFSEVLTALADAAESADVTPASGALIDARV